MVPEAAAGIPIMIQNAREGGRNRQTDRAVHRIGPDDVRLDLTEPGERRY
jgi:hypothetical protein